MKVFLDACVLYPALVRRLVMDAAAAGMFQPLWSARVLEEWRRAVAAKLGPEAEDAATAAAHAMQAAFPGASVAADPGLEATLHLPDPADTHVLAAAVAGGAGAILTFNLRDFPRRTLAGHGIEARHPDGFLWELLSTHEKALLGIANVALCGHGIEPALARAALKRARLSRFGKAFEGLRHANPD